jgi:hypothetical protein
MTTQEASVICCGLGVIGLACLATHSADPLIFLILLWMFKD